MASRYWRFASRYWRIAGVAEASVSEADDAYCGAAGGASPDGVEGGGGDEVAEDMRR